MVPTTRSWKNRRENRQRDQFIGRAEPQAIFGQNFDEAEDPYLLFSITGQGGVGKSTLLKRFEHIAHTQANALVITCDDHHTSPALAMGHIAAELAKLAHKHTAFDERYAKYRELLQQIEGDPKAPRTMVKWLSLGISDFAIKSLRVVPGVGAFVSQTDPQAAADALTELINYGIDRWGNKDEVQLLREPERILTPLFVKLLNTVCQQHRLVLMFDVFERTAPGLSAWLRALLSCDEYGDLDTGLTFVISGRDPLEQHWTALAGLICHLPLEPFTEQETRQYLGNKAIIDETLVTQIHVDTAGLPVLVELLAATNPQPGLPLPDVSHDAVERFLQWTPVEQRAVALLAAVPRQFNQDILAAALDQDAASVFTWLSNQSYVRTTTERGWFYHEKVRELMLRHLHHTTPSTLHAAHVRLTQFFNAAQQQLQLPATETYANATWRQLESERLYHALHAHPEQAILTASNTLLFALDGESSFVEPLAQLCQQASHELKDAPLLAQAHRFQAIAQAEKRDEYTALLNEFNALEQLTYLDVAALAIFYARRGRAYYQLQNYLAAVTDLTQAITRQPDNVANYRWRGATYYRLQDYSAAVADFTQAITRQPDDGGNYYWRGLTYYRLQDYSAAVADLSQAITRQPDDPYNYIRRGRTYYQLQDYSAAVADFTQAITHQPDDGGNYYWRGATYYRLEDYSAALADLTQAITRQPDDGDNYFWRGRTAYALQDYPAALADLTQAITHQPDDGDNYYWRGRTYYALQDYPAAVADLSQAITRQPDDPYNYFLRGRTYYRLEDYPTAVADLTQAITHQPDTPYNYHWRGRTYYRLEDYPAAVADFTQAITHQPDDGDNYFWRGRTAYALQDYPAAVADFTQAITRQPDDGDNYYWRGLTYYALQDYPAAVADLSQAITRQPDDPYNYHWRGLIYLGMADRTTALAALHRAVELQPKWPSTYFWLAFVNLHLGQPAATNAAIAQLVALTHEQLAPLPPSLIRRAVSKLLKIAAGAQPHPIPHWFIGLLAHLPPTPALHRAIQDTVAYLAHFPHHPGLQAIRQPLQAYLAQHPPTQPS